ncbi:hypothetical protein L9F63_009963, partial [Diploptera punctata]
MQHNVVSHTEVDACRNLLCLLHEKVEVLKDLLLNKIQDLNEAQCDNENLQNELEILKRRCSELKIIEINEKKCKNQIEKWKYKVADMNTCSQALKERNEVLEKVMETLSETLEEYKQHIDKSDERAVAFQEEMHICKCAFQCMQKKFAVLQNLLREKCDSLNKVNEELKAEKQKNNDDTLKKRILELENEVHMLKKLLNDYKKQIQNSEDCISTSCKEMDVCKSTLDSIEDKVTILQKLLKDKCEDVRKAEVQSIDWSKDQIENITLMADKADKYIGLVQIEADTCRSILNSLQDKVSSLKNLLRESCEDLTKALNEKEALQKELDNLKEEHKNLLSATTEDRYIKEELETKTELVENLQSNLNESNAQLIDALQQLKQKQTLKQNIKTQVCKLKERLQDCESQQSVIDRLQNEVTCLKAEIRHLTKLQEKTNSE